MTAYVTHQGSELRDDVSLGLYGATVRRVTGLGQVTIAGTGVAANDIWPLASIYPWMTGATSLELVSVGVNAANDTAAGTGAQSITVNGLDINLAEVSETKPMNGATPVALTTQFYRINSMSIAAAGSGGRNAGEIRVRDVGGAATVRCVMPISTVADLTPGVSKGSQFTVPAGHVLLIDDIDIQINSSAGGGGGTVKGADAMLYFRGNAAGAPIRLPRTLTTTDSGSGKNLDPKTPIPIFGGTDFQLRCSYTSAAGIILSGSWEGTLYRRIP